MSNSSVHVGKKSTELPKLQQRQRIGKNTQASTNSRKIKIDSINSQGSVDQTLKRSDKVIIKSERVVNSSYKADDGKRK